MNIHNSSSIDLNSSDDKKNDVNDAIVLMNNQYLTVRRPDENNILDYLDFDQQQNNNIVQKEQIINAESPQQSLNAKQISISVYQQSFKVSTNYNQYVSKLMMQNERLYTAAATDFEEKYQNILNDQSYSFSAIEKQKLQLKKQKYLEKIKELYSYLYFILGILYYFEITIQISFGSNLIFNFSFYILYCSIMIIESMVMLKRAKNKDRYQSVFHTILSLIIIINCFIDFQYFPILITPQLYFLQCKYYKIKCKLIQYNREANLINTLMIYIVYIHIAACLLFIISEYSNQNMISEKVEADSWGIKYLYSIYWSITTITTLGQDLFIIDTKATIIAIIIIQFGNIIVIIYILFQTPEFVIQQDQYSQNMQIIQSYLNQHKVNSNLKTQILNFLKHRWSEKYLSKTDQEIQILQQLPRFLGEDLKMELFYNILKFIPFFEKLSKECYRELILQLKEYKYQNDEILEQTGLYFCSQGKFDLVLPNNVKLKNTPQQSKYYGIQYLFYEKQHPCQAVSINQSTFVHLSRHTFLKVLRKYPKDYQIYRMLMESKQLEDGLKCYLCLSPAHCLDECPKIHLVVDRLQVLSQHLMTNEMFRQKRVRRKDRCTNAVFTQRFHEDAASMYQELQIQDETAKHDIILQPYKTSRKKSKSLDSDEISKQLQKSNSGHSLSAIQKPQGSGLSFSTFSMFKDVQGQRKISKQQDSDKISSNSQNNRQHQSSSNSFKELPLMMNMEDKVVDDSLFGNQQRNRKVLIGKQTTTSIKVTPPNTPLQAIPSVSDVNTVNEDNQNSFHQLSMSSKRYSSPRKKQSEKPTIEENKQLDLMEMQQMEFELPVNLIYYFPQFNIQTVVSNYKSLQK